MCQQPRVSSFTTHLCPPFGLQSSSFHSMASSFSSLSTIEGEDAAILYFKPPSVKADFASPQATASSTDGSEYEPLVWGAEDEEIDETSFLIELFPQHMPFPATYCNFQDEGCLPLLPEGEALSRRSSAAGSGQGHLPVSYQLTPGEGGGVEGGRGRTPAPELPAESYFKNPMLPSTQDGASQSAGGGGGDLVDDDDDDDDDSDDGSDGDSSTSSFASLGMAMSLPEEVARRLIALQAQKNSPQAHVPSRATKAMPMRFFPGL